jgi:NADPH:quinone reductase-like Zn-dependent oxidoreductase
LVWPGDGYRRFGADGLELSPSAVTDWERLLHEVDEVDALIHLWSLDGPVEADAAELLGFQETTCGGVIALLQALGSANRTLPDVWLVTAGAQSTGGDDHDVRPAQAPLWGLGRVLRNEQGGRRCRMVDLGAACTERDIGALLSELETTADGDGELAFRDGRRLARRQGRMTAHPVVYAEGRSMVSPQGASFRLACRVPGSLDSLHLRETEAADPAPDEVAIRVTAAGLNLRDVLVALGMAFAAGREDVDEEVLGWECAGIVEACGSAVSHVRPGDAVLAITGGALGSRVIARAGQVARKPPSLGFEEAATLPVAFVTAEYALTALARVAPGDRVLIHSASGGVGLAALQVARRAGAEVLATAGSPEKRAYLESLGVRDVMDSRSLAFADEVLRRTGGEGVDVVLNSLPGEAIAKGLSVLRPHGRFIELGKRDIYEDRELHLGPFRNNRSFHGLDLYALFRDRPEAVDPILRSIVHDVEAGSLSPLPHQDFDVDEAETAFRLMAQARHIGKVVLTVRRPRYAVVPRERAPLFHEDGTYLLAGGLGGFGIAVADWMVRHGARHIVLTSRTGRPHEEDAPALEALLASPATVEAHVCDAADADATGRLLDHIRETMPPLKGVLHAAMVLDDDLLGKLDYSRFDPVLAPKVAGAWNLHELTLEDDLDLFVLFSSISGFVGQPGQASYAAASVFLDALADHRRALGRPALAVDWGAIAGVGYMSRHGDIQRRLQRQGLATLTPDEACAALEELVRGGVTRACVARVDLAAWAERAAAQDVATPNGPGSPELHPGAPERLWARVAAAPSVERPPMLERYLVEKTARVMETSPDRVDSDRPMPEMGLDSLMAVELRTAIRVDLGVDVPIVDLLEGLSLRTLASTVLAELERR